ncbi:MAG: tRNA glutamyl-Q(34) synthetase GluQRS [Acidobacteriia bacterium]|nr:tRNA glutamyl-Q(34) synthetase GluQRS [Terriglobia bacterium]
MIAATGPAVPGSAPRGRYAPSPTGDLHLGNASTALLAWLSIRSRGGSFVIRMEDLDRQRVRRGAAERILDDLAWLGLDWDEGPDVGGPHAPYEQSRRASYYDEACERLRAAGRAYPCFCSRKDVRTAASAPQEPGDEVRYPGTCRALEPAEAARRIAEGRPHALRFRVEASEAPSFDDRVLGARGGVAPGDFVIRRADGTAAYQLAVVVDDAGMGITDVVRGGDLLASTARQLLLYDALGLTPPAFGHVPLLLGPDGVRLSKRHVGASIRETREAGVAAERVVGRFAELVGLRETTEPLGASALVEGFSLERLSAFPQGIRLDPAHF